jgi:hypothetical protein
MCPHDAGAYSSRSIQTCGSPGSSPGSTWTMRGRQQTAQSSVYVWDSPPPKSIESSSVCPQKGHSIAAVDLECPRFGTA